MKKKVVSILLCAVMLAAMAAGCSDKSQEADTSGDKTKTESSDGESGKSGGSGDAFDAFTRPGIKEDGKLTIACIHPKPEVESQKRSILQCELEAENRGWEFQDIVYQSDSEWADLFKNVMNQVVDGVIMNSTMPNGTAAMSLIYQIGNDVGWSGKFAFATAGTIQVHNERILPIQTVCDIYTNLEILDTVDSTAGGADPATYVSDAAKAWFQKYGTELTGVIGSCDFLAMPCAEAAEQSAGLANPDLFVAGIDGGSDAWNYIRSGGYFKYSYAQPFEMFTHKVFEAIEQIQVKGLNPGDEGCILAKAGEVLYSEGLVISQENVPEVGANINSAFDYYDDDPDAWYNWEGTYTVSE